METHHLQVLGEPGISWQIEVLSLVILPFVSDIHVVILQLGCMQQIREWGWVAVDAVDYRKVADFYGCKYASRSDSVQAPNEVEKQDVEACSSSSLNFNESSVLIVTCTRPLLGH